MTAAAHRDAFDVAVIGAGPAGSAAARYLGARGVRVALVERSAFEVPRVGESLAPAVQPLLGRLGLWPEFLALEPLPSFGTRSHWGEEAARVHSHLMNPWGCGWHVERLAFDRMLAEAAVRSGAVPFFRSALGACDTTSNGWQLELRAAPEHPAGGARHCLSARVLIDATGRTARSASRLGARRLTLDRLVAVSALFGEAEIDREGYVLVETTADGWWYSAPIPGGGMIAMLMTDSDLCRRLKLIAVAVWEGRLRTALGTSHRLSKARRITNPQVSAAVSHRLRRCERQRPWLAIGDAALAVDPISGSGVVRALRMAIAGAEATGELLEGGDAADILRRYEDDRDRECTRYLEERARYYGLEQRWHDYPFWARRGGLSRSSSAHRSWI